MDLNEDVGLDDLTLKPTQSYPSFVKQKPKSTYVAMTVAVAVGRGGFRGRTKEEEKGNKGKKFQREKYQCQSLATVF